ncbi:MAG: PilN domain-containing protein [Candidatus Rokubacteria bacterium]|nr:PilN domain-containing protein [Candidatus Rokubacteria bacterium]
MITINLAPPRQAQGLREFRFQLPSLDLGIVFLLVYIAAGSGITIYWAHLYREEARLSDAIAKGTSELERLKPITGQASKVKDQLADLQKRVKTIEELTKDQSKSIRILDAFAGVVPNDLWVTRMEERGNVLKVTGTAFSPAAVSDFMTNLRASGKFKEVEIVVSRQDLSKTPRLVTFEVTCRFEG